MKKVNQEIELKVKLKNPRGIRARLKALRAQRVEKFREIDVYFDTAKDNFYKSDRVLRLRKWGKVATIAFKGKRAKVKKLHDREEIEVRIEDLKKMGLILERLGFQKRDTHEKIREIYKYKGVEILIDRLPFIGRWLEIEGPRGKILEVAQKLKIDPNEGETRHYGEIFWAYCQKQGLPLIREMTFKKERQIKGRYVPT